MLPRSQVATRSISHAHMLVSTAIGLSSNKIRDSISLQRGQPCTLSITTITAQQQSGDEGGDGEGITLTAEHSVLGLDFTKQWGPITYSHPHKACQVLVASSSKDANHPE